MPEDIEQQNPESLDLGRYLDIVRRRHMQFLIPVLACWMIVWGMSWVLPKRFKSTTTIQIQQPAIERSYVLPNMADDLQQRLQTLPEQIMSRTRLLVIIDKLHLYQDGKHILTPDQEIDRMRKDIDVELVRDPQNQITAFQISYSAPSAKMAQAVTAELARLFISENLAQREKQSIQTTDFISSQLNDARQSLAGQDARVREFKAAHSGELPSQQASNLQILSGMQAQMQSEQDALNTARQQRTYLQSLIAQYQSIQQSDTKSGGTPGGLAALDERLNTLQAQLTDMSTRYTDHYPGVISLKAEIARTEQARDKLAATLKASAAHAKQSGNESNGQISSNPTQATPLLQLQSQLKANQLEIADREHSIASLTERINSYQGRLNAEPAIEQQLAELTRGYDQSQSNYNDLLKRKQESEMASDMEQAQGGERFVPLDPPSLPSKPYSPNRLKFSEMGLAFGIGLGAALVFLLEFLDDRLHNDQDIEKLLLTPVLSEIPEIIQPLDERHEKRRTAMGWAMAALVLVVILSGSAFSYIHR
jgi:protein tyrosine kinase modulator